MKPTLLKLIVGLPLSLAMLIANAQDITYQTVSIFNVEYLASHQWKALGLPIISSTDLNQQELGGVYYPPKVRGTNQQEGRATMANQQMEVEVDLQSQSSEVYLVDFITLHIIKSYDISSDKIQSGHWQAGSRTSDYRPYFLILPDKRQIVIPVEEMAVWPAEEYMDSRFIFDVEVSPTTKNKAFEYGFELHFVNANDPEDNFSLTSDQHYFIGRKD